MLNKKLRFLEWDSDFFNKRIYSILDVENVSADNFHVADLICNKVDAGDFKAIERLQKLSFNFVEGEITYSKKLTNFHTESFSSTNIANTSDIPFLLDIGNGAFIHSRFREPWFTQNQKNSFYQLWIKNAVLGFFDDVCLKISNSNSIEGLITLKKIDSEMKVGLVAVSPKSKGKGIGKELLRLAENYSVNCGCKKMIVSTQSSNIHANRLYSSAGYLTTKVSYWFYNIIGK